MPPKKTLWYLYHCQQDKGETILSYLQIFRAMVVLLKNMTDKLAVYYFKTQLQTKKGYFFEFLRHRNWMSMMSIIVYILSNLEKTKEEFKSWK